MSEALKNVLAETERGRVARLYLANDVKVDIFKNVNGLIIADEGVEWGYINSWELERLESWAEEKLIKGVDDVSILPSLEGERGNFDSDRHCKGIDFMKKIEFRKNGGFL